MVSPGVVAGFAVIDAALLGQVAYAIRDYAKHRRNEQDRFRDR
jgi:hypothetical protein